MAGPAILKGSFSNLLSWRVLQISAQNYSRGNPSWGNLGLLWMEMRMQTWGFGTKWFPLSWSNPDAHSRYTRTKNIESGKNGVVKKVEINKQIYCLPGFWLFKLQPRSALDLDQPVDFGRPCPKVTLQQWYFKLEMLLLSSFMSRDHAHNKFFSA